MPDPDLLTADPGVCKEAIAQVAQALKALTQRSQQTQWHISPEAYAASPIWTGQPWQEWPLATVNDRHHIAWERGQRPLWLCQQITVPVALQDFPLAGLSLRLGLTWWAAAAAIYVNGELVQAGDLFDCFTRIVLSDRIAPGDTFTVALHLISPGHDDGALVRSEVIYESADPAAPEPGFVADELTVLKTFAAKLAPERLPAIAAAIAPLDWSTVTQQATFQAELAALRQRLQPLSDWIKQRQIACVGHAHLDLAWLWPVADTWHAAERTFRSVLSLQADFPELTYTHSSPALFDWLETHQPTLFQAIVDAVKAGTWAIDAGLWVEPELNTIGGESLARQILYGQRYTRSRFGQTSAIAWLPDSFGFSWQLPQLLKLGGIQYFATQKLRWNEATTFPHSLFWWEGLDGTAILSLTLPPIGTDIDPIQMATHGADWEAQTGLTAMLWLPGMGDHGGGPTRDMLEKARRWSASPFFPALSFTTVTDHLQHLKSWGGVPVWRDELYLELHRGCYTVHADQKWFNRRCEEALREAELFAALAHMQGQLDYPRAALETAWKQILFNQFHDILPGTAIPEVFATVNPAWQVAYGTAKGVRDEALRAIADHLPLTPPPQANAIPLYLFNSLNWDQTDLVEIPLADLPLEAQTWGVLDATTGKWLPCQFSYYTDLNEIPPGQASTLENQEPRILVLVTVPAVGYRILWLVPHPGPTNGASTCAVSTADTMTVANDTPWQLENDWLQAEVDPVTGNLLELRARDTQTNIVRSPANQLQAFRDAGQYWDAWDIAPDYADHPLPPAQLQSITWLERGPLRQRLRVVRTVANSTLQQDYVLDQPLPYLKVATVADWQATQVVLKVAFPLSIQAEHATYEIPFGAIARSTHPTDPHQQAKWEVPALRWADLSDGQMGLSLLTDYKHGFDAQPDQLRLTLLKAPLWPDPQADRGQHRLLYALYPHQGDWRDARTPNWAIALGTGIRVWVGAGSHPLAPAMERGVEAPSIPPLQGSFLAVGTDRVQVAALKLAEDADDRYVLRCWEMYGQETTVTLGPRPWERTDLLEAAIAIAEPARLAPWQIATFKLPAFLNKSLRAAADIPGHD